MIHILTDSCSDLSGDLLRQHQIDIIRLKVFLDGRSFTDGLDIDPATIFQTVGRTNQLPKTSAPSEGEFCRFLDRDGEIIYIGIGSRLSATVPNAMAARQMLEGRSIRIIDSANLSTGIGLLALKAADLRDQGFAAAEIERQILAAIPKVHTSFVVETLEYLAMSGRASSIQHLFSSLLRIRPVIEVRSDGTLGAREKIRGSRQKALESLLVDFGDHLTTLDPKRVFVTHSGCDSDAQFLSDEIRKLAPVENVLITIAGATISSHCGPDTIGILYLTK